MKKFVSIMMVSVLMLITVSVQASEKKNSGGIEGLLAGCCFGQRGAADYNDGIGNREYIPWFLVGCCLGARTQMAYTDGKSVHFRDWGHLVPFVGFVFFIWDGIDGANGLTRDAYAEQYGSTYY